jgi:hypothetical protein
MSNIADPNPLSGADSNSQQTGAGGGQTGQSNDFDPIMADIDSVFGGLEDSSSQGGSGNGIKTSGGPDIVGQTGQQHAPDETTGMSAQQLAAHFQSKYDKLNAEYSRVLPEYEKYKNVADFVNQAYDDPSVKAAFLSELAPDLYKPADPYEGLQEQLKKEFGEEFTPDDDEAARPLSKTWRYYKRVEELYKNISDKQSGQIPMTLKELRAQKKAQAEAARNAAAQEKAEIMKDLNWTESDWQDLEQWVPQLKTKHLAKWRQHLKRSAKSGRAPNLVNQFGGHTVTSKPGVFNELDSFFG